MYRTFAWPPDATLRAIWRAIVVLPVPWAPPMSISSPARRPPPIVLSIGVKPSGTGWYSPTRPLVTLSLRSTSTSIAERGAMLPFGPSRRHVALGVAPVSVVTFRSSSGLWLVLVWGMLAPGHGRTATRWSRSRQVHRHAGDSARPGAGCSCERLPDGRRRVRRVASVRDAGQLVPEAHDDARAALEVVDEEGLVGRVRVAARLGEAQQDDRQPEGPGEGSGDGDGAALPDEHGIHAVDRAKRPCGCLRRRVIRVRVARIAAVDEGRGHGHARRRDLGHEVPQGREDGSWLLVRDQPGRDLGVGVGGNDGLRALPLEAAPHAVHVQGGSRPLVLEDGPAGLADQRLHRDRRAVRLVVEGQRRQHLAILGAEW